MKTVLVTSFEPFGGEAIFPSWEAVKVLQGREIAGARVVTCQLACVFDLALQQLNAALAEHQPDCVLAVGQAGGCAEISVERVAININDARIPDNHGKQPIDTPVIPGGPDAYFSILPIKLMVNALREQGIPASVSHTAGTFVCKHVMYGLLHALAQHPDAASGGFVHIPLCTATGSAPSRRAINADCDGDAGAGCHDCRRGDPAARRGYFWRYHALAAGQIPDQKGENDA